MNEHNTVEAHKAKTLLESVLVGTGFSRFCFDSSFSLFFFGPKHAGTSFAKDGVQLQLLGRWWFEALDSWRFPRECSEEAILAFELADFRWREGSVVEGVTLRADRTVFSFAGGSELHVDVLEKEGEPAWIALPGGRRETDAEWIVSCEGGQYYTHERS